MCWWEKTHINKLSYKSQDKDDNKCTHKLSHDSYFLYNVSCFWNGTKIECVKALEVKDLYIDQKNRWVIQFDLRVMIYFHLRVMSVCKCLWVLFAISLIY